MNFSSTQNRLRVHKNKLSIFDVDEGLINSGPQIEPLEGRLLLSVAVISNPQPSANQIQVPFRPTLSASIVNAAGHPMNVTFNLFDSSTNAWVPVATYAGKPSGTFKADTSAFVNAPSTNYQWRVTAVDTVTSESSTGTYTFTTDRALKLKFSVQLTMSADAFRERQLHPVMGDVDNDGTQEIILTAGDSLWAINGKTGAVKWRIQGDARETAAELADLNGDGVPEILYGLTGARLRAVNGDGTIRWTSARLHGEDQPMFPILTADLDGNGKPTIFFLTEDQSPTAFSGKMSDYTGAINKLDSNGNLLATTWMYHPCWGGASLADVNGDGKFELFVSDRKAGYNGVPAHGMAAYDANTLQMLWSRPDIQCSSSIPILADVNGDGKLDVVAQKITYDSVMILDAMTGTTIRDYGGPLPTHGTCTYADVNEDGHPDLIIATSYPESDAIPKDFVVLDLATGQIIFRPTFPYWTAWPPRVGDVIGDGNTEILAAMGNQTGPGNATGSFPLLIYDKSFKLIETEDIKDGQLSPAKVFDTDGDGLNEVLVLGRAGRLYVYDTQASTPNPAPNSWVQGYSNLRQEAAAYVPPPKVTASQAPTVVNSSSNSVSDGATNVPLGPTLSVDVQDPQNDLLNVTFEVYRQGAWQTVKTYSNVTQGTYRADTAGFVADNSALFKWRVTVIDSGGHWDQKSYSFTTTAALFGSEFPNWAYRMPVTVNHTQVASDATDIPVLVDVTAPELAASARSSGNDIFFTSANGVTKLPHEIESYDAATGHLVAWVKVPSLWASADTVLYMFYGNPSAANQQDAKAVWGSGSLTVQHLEEGSGAATDSSAAGINATPQNGVSQGVAGLIARGYSFDGVNDRLTLPAILYGQTSFTFEALAKPGNKQGTLFSERDSSGKGISLQYNAAMGQFEFNVDSVKLAAKAIFGQWHQVVIACASHYAALYLDGQLVTYAATDFTAPNIAAIIGDDSTGTQGYLGLLDEVKISSIGRDQTYVGDYFSSVFNRGKFISLGSAQGRVPDEAPSVTDNSVPDGAVNVPLKPTLSVAVQDPQNDNVDLTFEISSKGGSWQTVKTYSRVAAGTYAADTSAYVTENSVLYTWRVTATDLDGNSTQKTFSFTSAPAVVPVYPGWAYRTQVTVNHTKVATDSSNFAVLVDVTLPALAAHAQSSGNDVFFTAADGKTKLPHEIESYNPATGHLVAWLQVPSISASTDVNLYMYYGNPTAANQQSASGVWDASYLTVQHMGETTGAATDSSAARNNGTVSGGVSRGVAGLVGNSYKFDGVSGRVAMPSILNGKNTFTIEALVNPQNTQGYIFSQRDASSNGVLLQYYAPTKQFELYVNKTRLVVSAAPGQWSNIAASYDGTTAKLYLNGKLVASAAATLKMPSIPAIIGDSTAGNRRFSGLIDELRVSNVARSDAYIGNAYNTVFNRNLFASFGSEEHRV